MQTYDRLQALVCEAARPLSICSVGHHVLSYLGDEQIPISSIFNSDF